MVIDLYSGCPRVYFTTSPTSAFTKAALRNIFCREEIPDALVTDNGSHFTDQKVDDWLKSVACRNASVPPQHTQSNGTGKNFVHKLKMATKSVDACTFDELGRRVKKCVLQCHNSVHATTGSDPEKYFEPI